MNLQLLLRSFEFDELFPTVAKMYPNAKRHRKEFKTAYDLLTTLTPDNSKKNIRYQVIESPYSNDYFFGAQDSSFKATWHEIAGKNIIKEHSVELSDEEIAANCLINTIFIGQHPEQYADSYSSLVGRKKK
ncbi:MAG: hypothetical protein IJ562_06050 [Prevotella sp.]|nr:hypothetical protein [Prevotella sp.]